MIGSARNGSLYFMDSRSVEELRNELERLMGEQIESLRAQTFGDSTKNNSANKPNALNAFAKSPPIF